MNLRRLSSLLLLATLLASSLLSGHAPSALADYEIERVLASGNADFAPGTFGLTGLVQEGGVQLLPLGALQRARESTVPLCRPLSGMGTAAYPTTMVINGEVKPSTHLYVVGGLTTGLQSVAETCHTTIINQTGVSTKDPATNRWFMDGPRLPRAVTQNQALAVRSQSGQGFLYSLGGAIGTNYLSIEHIYRAPIDPASGAIGSWITDTLKLPGADDQGNPEHQGRHSFALATHKAGDGTKYLYLFGGIRRYELFFTFTDFRRDVWRTRINADGSLGDGTQHGWTRMADIPIQQNAAKACAGLYGSQAVAFPVVNANGNAAHTLYLMGGRYEGPNCNQLQVASADVYRATLANDGALGWDSGAEGNIYRLSQPLFGHQAVGYNQKIYVVGGYGSPGGGSAAAPQRSVLGSYAREDQSLELFVESNFIANPNVLPAARYDHGLLLGTFDNLPIIYTLGGRSNANTNTSNDFADTVYYSIPSVDEATTHGFASQGIYLSTVVDLRAQAQPTGMAWTSTIDNSTMDVEISYRISPSQATLTSAPWRVVDGDPDAQRTSQVGTDRLHSVALSGAPEGRYLQYRAILRTRDGSASPRLIRVALKANIPGFPNLLAESATLAEITPNGPSHLPDVKLGNKDVGGDAEQLLPADIAGAGTFFVDMYLFPPGTTPVTPSFGLGGADRLGEVFAELNRVELDAGKSFLVPGVEWKETCFDDNGNPQTDCPVADFKRMMHDQGIWTVIMMVDSGNGVREAASISEPWEAENFYRFTVVSQVQYKRVHLPLITRPQPATTSTVQESLRGCAPARLIPAARGRGC